MDFHIIQYHCRGKYYHTMKLIAKSHLQQNPDDDAIKLQYCVALILENQIGEAIRELDPLLNQHDVGLAAILMMIHSENLCEVPDCETLITLENRLKIERKKATELMLYYAANFYLQIRNYEQAREYTDSLFRLNRNSMKGFLLKGWLELNNGKLTAAADCFRAVQSQDGQNFDAAIGEVLSLSQDEAVNKLNQLIVKYPRLTIPLLEKMKLLTNNSDWEEVVDISNRILDIDSMCIPALQFKAICDIRIRGDTDFLIKNTDKILLQVKEQEPSNWMINYEFGTLLSRLYGCNDEIIRQSIRFIEEALLVVPNNVNVLMELAHQNYLLRICQKSVDLYKQVARLDDSATGALIGLIKCKIMQGDYNEEIKQQIDFLLDVYTEDPSADLLFLQATKADDGMEEKLLSQAIDLKFKNAERLGFGLQFLMELDTAFILEALVRLPPSLHSRPYKIAVLQKLNSVIPGLIEAWILKAEIHFEMESYKEAETALEYVLNHLNEKNSDANLLLARILIQQKKYEDAESTLELCLSQNLNVQSKPLFHFLIGKIHKCKDNFQECINSMECAIRCITGSEHLKPLDLASTYLDLSSCYQVTSQSDAAIDAIQKATHLLEGTPQEYKITMARAELELWKNDAKKALALLSSIPVSSTAYLEARIKIADVHLKYSKDANKYIECYKELVEQNPSHENLIKLAEAYFSIRRITEAVETYEKAIKMKSSPKLSKKLAEIYCKCHQYGKAVRCYLEAGAEGSLDLAHLLFRLKEWDKAESALSRVSFLEKVALLAKIKEKLGDVTTAINLLNEAYKKCSRTSDTLALQLCCQMAELETNVHDFDSAIRHYKSALSHCKDNISETTSIQISLSKIYLQVNDWSSCQTICSSLLNRDPNNEMALLMSGDLSFRKCDFLAANNLFHKLLIQKPTYWLSLVRMVEVKRRMGILKGVKPYLENARALNSTDSGLAYCTGLYYWYDNKLEEALKYFDSVKYDPEWGQQALYNMVEIYLAENENHEIAESLLQEIRPNSSDEETTRTLLVNFVLLATKDKHLVEKAMNELTLLASRDMLRVGASFGLATGYILQKQGQRARNVLKIIAKTAWQFEEAEYLERCWVMLADHYVQAGKLELAHELIKKILTYNAGCRKAHELFGIIAEKDQKYGDAVGHYLKAWNLSGQEDPNVAYRLGACFLKAKKYADAIITCQMIFKKIPDNVKIRKDIYEKSLSLLRT